MTFENCWAFDNGFSPKFDRLGDGNGFKAGGWARRRPTNCPPRFRVTSCGFASPCTTRPPAFTRTISPAAATGFNNTAYRNAVDFNMLCRTPDNRTDVDGYGHVLKNNIGYKGGRELANFDASKCESTHNVFDGLTDSDFVNLDESELTKPRQANGDLPEIRFLHPSETSRLADLVHSRNDSRLMKLTVLQDERFTCQSCTSCCRSWYVELMPGEAERIAALAWPQDDPLRGVQPIVKHAGKTMLGRRRDGACLFLSEANGLCRIHEQFGVASKPLGCRVFPFQIAPTFEGEATVTGRFDCPTIRKNVGADYTESQPDLRRFAAQMNLDNTFDEQTRCGLERDQIAAVGDFVGTMMGGFAGGAQRRLHRVAVRSAGDDRPGRGEPPDAGEHLPAAEGGRRSQLQSCNEAPRMVRSHVLSHDARFVHAAG